MKCAVLIAAALVVCSACDFGFGALNAPTTSDRARELERAGKYDEALVLFEQAVAEGRDGSFVRHGMGRCNEALGRYDDALASYDASISFGMWYPAYVSRMSCMSRMEGVDAAVRWLENQPVPTPHSHEFHRIVGSFHWEAQRIDDVIAAYTESARLACEVHDFRFDADGWVIRDDATLRRSNHELYSTWPTLEDLARLTYSRGETDAALMWATKAVSMGQLILTSLGYYPPSLVEVGNIEGRLVRAHVFMDRGRLTDALVEIELARRLAERGNYQPAKDDVGAASDRLVGLAATSGDANSDR